MGTLIIISFVVFIGAVAAIYFTFFDKQPQEQK